MLDFGINVGKCYYEVGNFNVLQTRASVIRKGTAFLYQKARQVLVQSSVGIKKWYTYHKVEHNNGPFR